MSLLFKSRFARTAAVGLSALAALTIASCGGGKDTSTTLDANGRYTTTSTDGAAVQYATLDAPGSEPTTRVARDASGAPALPDGHVPAGSVYKFTPLGMGAANIEIRVPFDPSLTAGQEPKLLVAMPGEQWAEASQARIDGNTLVAQVPQLMYAVVTTDSTDTTPQSQATAQDTYKSGGASQATAPAAPRLSVRVASSTTPQLPPPDQRGIIQLSQSTRLDLQLAYNLPTGCTSTPRVRAYGIFVPRTGGNSQIKTVELANAPVSTLSGTINVSQNLGASENGAWTFAAAAYCTNMGQLLPRYAYLATGPVINVNVQATTAAPLITQAPQNASATEGNLASFSVIATGPSLAYQWQRSNNGGLDYANVTNASAASVNLTTSLADNASLWRVVVRNTSGAVTSTAASLTVVQRAVAPAVTSDPANQAVIEGETGSFSAAASGTPAPSIQWQTRPAPSAGTTPASWTDIPGATAVTYTTGASTLAINDRQYRAIFTNSAGSAATLPATLTVSARIIAPSITIQPIAQSVQAGQFGLFSISASGTSPLSYQWFKNGQALVAANATEVLIPADAADVGTSYQISVQVSNSAGTVTSAVVSMAVTAVVNTGTLVSPTQGGVVTAGSGTPEQPAPSLNIPAGALASATVITFVAESSAAVGLPSDIEPLGDVLTIGPANLAFLSQVILSLPAPDNLPTDKVMALITLPTANSPASSAKQAKGNQAYLQASINSSSLRRLAQSGKVRSGVMQMAAGAPIQVACGSTNNFAGGRFNTVITGAVSVLTAAVPVAMCDNNPSASAPPPGNAPSDSDKKCTNEADFINLSAANVPYDASLVSRHVDCRSSTSNLTSNTIYVDLIENNGNWRYATAQEAIDRGPNYTVRALGAFETIEVRSSIFGASNSLNKQLNIRMRLRNYTPDASYPAGAPKPTSITVRPRLQCQADRTSETNRCTFSQGELKVDLTSNAGWGGNEGKDFNVNFNWVAPGGNEPDVETYNVSWDILYYTATGSVQRGADNPNYFSIPNANIKIRCDRGVAQVGSDGCILPEAAPVYVLKTSDPTVSEAAEHVREAQGSGSPGKFLLKTGTRAVADSSVIGINALQRLKNSDELVPPDPNRTASCSGTNALINARPQKYSFSCTPASPGGPAKSGCECDEYPFNATYQGAAYLRDLTSVKWINGSQNRNAGSGKLSQWYKRERVLDLGTGRQMGLPSAGNSDYFWVNVPLAD